MCNPVGEVADFIDIVNDYILKNNTKDIPKLIGDFERKGYMIFFKKITSQEYLNKQLVEEECENFISNASHDAYLHNGIYQGTIVFTPMFSFRNLWYLVKHDATNILPEHTTEIKHVYDFIYDISVKKNKGMSVLGHKYNKKGVKPNNNTNIYVMCAYLVDINMLKDRARNGDKRAGETLRITIPKKKHFQSPHHLFDLH
ncbi:hypothetical protein J7J26_00030 [Candidatus Micrarchaeota archaeon]|nr:hypothetical protein [Candidatus Micrarchaeota archaeon]